MPVVSITRQYAATTIHYDHIHEVLQNHNVLSNPVVNAHQMTQNGAEVYERKEMNVHGFLICHVCLTSSLDRRHFFLVKKTTRIPR